MVVSADHGHTSQIIPIEAKSPGQSATLVTADGAPLQINSATNPVGQSQEHTGTQVRIAAQGPQAANLVGVTFSFSQSNTLEESFPGRAALAAPSGGAAWVAAVVRLNTR